MLWKRSRRGWDIDVHRPSLGPRWGRAEPADDGRDGGRGGPPLGTTASCAPGAHVPNMYQRYKLAFSELKQEYDVTKYRDFPRVRAFEVKGWMSLSCTFVAPYYLTFSGPCPPHFGGAPAIPPLSRQSGQDPLPPPPKSAVGPHRRHCSAAVPPPRDRIKTPLFLAMWVCARKIALHVPFRGARDKR